MWDKATVEKVNISEDYADVQLVLTDATSGVKTPPFSLRVPTSDLSPERLAARVRARIQGMTAAKDVAVTLPGGTVISLVEAISGPTAREVWFSKLSVYLRLLSFQQNGLALSDNRVSELKTELERDYDPSFVA